MSESATPHARPFYCPYCGEEDFVPYGEQANAYYCNSCTRHFLVKFLGLSVPQRAPSSEHI